MSQGILPSILHKILWIWTVLAKSGLHLNDLSYLSYYIKNNVIIMIIITMIRTIIVRIMVLLFGYLCLILLFFWFYLFIQRRMPTNACIIYFSIKRWSDWKIWKVYFSILKLKIRRSIKYIVTSAVGRISWWQERLLQGFRYSHFFSGSAEMISFHRPPLSIFFLNFWLFVLLMAM